MSAQMTRGRSHRENLSKFISEFSQTILGLTATHYSDERLHGITEDIPTATLREPLLDSQRLQVEPTNLLLLKTMLTSVAEIAELLYKRTWTLARFLTPCLFSGEEPVVLISPDAEKFGYGVLTAERIYMPVSPTAALLLSHPWTSWPETCVHGSRALAQRLNWAMLSYPSNDRLLMHPDVKGHPLPSPGLLAGGSMWPWQADPESEPPGRPTPHDRR
jgi:Protein of unknown function (DUF4238)